jgi:hypothetical protein
MFDSSARISLGSWGSDIMNKSSQKKVGLAFERATCMFAISNLPMSSSENPDFRRSSARARA